MISPEGIEYNFYTNKFGTPKMSALYTLVNMKKDPSKADESLLVTQVSKTWKPLLESLERIDVAFDELEIGEE